MPFSIDSRGWITGAPDIRTMPRPNIEHGPLKSVKGIIVHQTDGETAESSLNSYRNANANGAHFLIDKDGTNYQVASLLKKTWHVGKLKSRCLAAHECTPAEFRIYASSMPTAINRMELRKVAPMRYPSNDDSIGIELVGRCLLDAKFIKPGMSKDQIRDLKSELGVYETVTTAQNAALRFLIVRLQDTLQISAREIFAHPTVSYKNPTEAKTAQWPGK